MAKQPKLPPRPEGVTREEWKKQHGVPVKGLDLHYDRIDRGETKHYQHLSDEEKQEIKLQNAANKPKGLKDNFKDMLPDALRATGATLTGGSVQCKTQWFGDAAQEDEARKENPSTQFITDDEGMRWRIEYRAVSKQQWEAAKYVIDKFMSLEKHLPEVKIKNLEADKKVKESKEQGYGEFEQSNIKEKAETVGLSVVTHNGFVYDPSWDEESTED